MSNVIFSFTRLCLFFLSLAFSSITFAQEGTALSPVNRQIKKTTRLAFLVPGAGQIINKKYWKAPIVWGTFGYCISAIQYNQQRLNLYRSSIIAASKGEELPDPSIAGTASSWRQMETFYQKNRDLSFLALIGVHLLSVLDAHVDANLSAFDVSEDLSLQLAPFVPRNSWQKPAICLKLNWQLGRAQLRPFQKQNLNGHRVY